MSEEFDDGYGNSPKKQPFGPVDFKTFMLDRKQWPSCPSCSDKRLVVSQKIVSCCNCSWNSNSIPDSFFKSMPLKALMIQQLVESSRPALEGYYCVPEAEAEGEDAVRSMLVTGDRVNEILMLRDFYVAVNVFYKRKSNKLVNIAFGTNKKKPAVVEHCDAFTSRDKFDAEIRGMFNRVSDCETIFLSILLHPDTGYVSTPSVLLAGIFSYKPPAIFVLKHDPWKENGVPEISADLVQNCANMSKNNLLDMDFPAVSKLDWESMDLRVGKSQPRYIAFIHVKGNINVTFYIIEDMDGGFRTEISQRVPGRTQKPTIKKIAAESVSEAMTKIKGRYQKILSVLEQSSTPIEMKLEMEIESDKNLRSVIGDINVTCAKMSEEASKK